MTYTEIALFMSGAIILLAGAGHYIFLYLADRQVQRIRRDRNDNRR